MGSPLRVSVRGPLEPFAGGFAAELPSEVSPRGFAARFAGSAPSIHDIEFSADEHGYGSRRGESGDLRLAENAIHPWPVADG